MDKNSTIKSRAYQMVSGDQVLPELIPLIAGETEILYPTFDDCPSLSDLYLAMKAQVDKLENQFGSLEEMDDTAEFTEDGYSYFSEDPDDIQNFAEVLEGESASSFELVYQLFVESVRKEFEKRPNQYGKYVVEEVCEAFKDSYVVHPDPKGGGWFKRVPGGTQEPVRVTTEDPWEPLEDNEHY